MKHSQNLIFARRLEGLDEPCHFELLQEFEHATQILWREEHKAYCRIDENCTISLSLGDRPFTSLNCSLVS